MGRKRKNPVRRYFTYNAAADVSRCNVATCNVDMKGQHAANLQRHLERHHHEIYKEICTQSAALDAGAGGSQELKRPRVSMQQKLTSMVPSSVAEVDITQEEILRACVELCTVNGRPFALMEDSGFRRLLDPLLHGTRSKMTINAENIRTEVAKRADDMREEIRREVKGMMVPLKADCVTRMDRSILVLATYDIELAQLYSITTDNGANLVKSVKMLTEETEAQSDSDDESNTQPEHEDVNDSSFNIDSTESWPVVLKGVRCAAHTLQLAVDDAMKKASVKGTIARAREVCKKLRCPTVMMMIKKLRLRKPILDCPTRWLSTYDMLQRLMDLRSFCVDMASTNREVFLTTDEWGRIDGIIKGLHPAKKTTLTLQSEQLTFGDFYGAWMRCIIETSKLNSPFSRCLSEAFKAREVLLLENDAFRAGIFLDPRYNVLLSDDDKRKARAHLSSTWASISLLSRRMDSLEYQESAESSRDSDDDLDVLLKEREKTRVFEESNKKRATKSISAMLDEFEKQKRLKKDADILNYWEEQRIQHHELYQLAKVVLACPATQLHELQDAEGLRAANKLKKAHIDYQRQIMKVRLATQTFSSAVSKALKFAQQLGLKDFQDCDGTAKFIADVDRAFDLLNSHSPRAQNFKAPLRKVSFSSLKATMLAMSRKLID
ncbi:zinc finger BED domain-containing protein 4-like [Ornithodoros turicata]|uniref:zinc finger BED domain-containing protein 4-like n=1 Tax=Ornithodoros turicata TaxID=34597 RepID=UPI003138E551